MRSANRNNGNNVGNVNTSGNCGNNNANNGNFAAPDSAGYRTWDIHPVNEIRDIGTGSLRPVGAIPEQRWGGRASVLLDRGASGHPDIEDVIGFDALWDSMLRCRRGVMWKGSVQSFLLNAPENIARLCDELHDGTYQPRRTRTFTVTSPKRRDIVCICFRDRVVQRSFNDNAIFPCMAGSWIYDNAACQPNKGTDFARNRLLCHYERQIKHDADFCVLRVDVRGYYAHLLTSVIESRFRAKCPEWAADFAMDTIWRQYGHGQGVYPGSQLVQIAGIDYLDPIDHAIKERMGVKGYVRYMDDLVLLGEHGHLIRCRDEIADRLAPIGLEPHPNKTRIFRSCDRVRFLGFDYRVTHDGRVVRTIDPASVKRMRRRVRRLHRLESDGLRRQGTTRMAYDGWRAHAAKGDSPRLLERCDEWFAGLEKA